MFNKSNAQVFVTIDSQTSLLSLTMISIEQIALLKIAEFIWILIHISIKTYCGYVFRV